MKLTPKTQNFAAGRKIFVFSDGTYEISNDMELPENAILGAEIPEILGIYTLQSRVGSFVILVSEEGVQVSTIWSHWGGSIPDGKFFYNNTDVTPSENDSNTVVYDSPGQSLNVGVGGFVDFGEFYICIQSLSGAGARIPLKISKDFNTITPLEFTEITESGGGIFDYPIVSETLGGVLYLGTQSDGQLRYGVFHLINVYDETVQNIPVEVVLPPNFTDSPRNRINSMIEYPGGKVAVIREREAIIYQYDEETLNFLYSKDWSNETNEDGWNGITYGIYPHLNICHDRGTLFIWDNYRLRAIDTTTDELRWEVMDPSYTWFSDNGAVSPITGNMFITKWDAEIHLFEYDVDDGSVVDSWVITDEFDYWGDPKPVYVGEDGRIHIVDGNKISIFNPEDETFESVIDTTDYLFHYWGKTFFLKNLYVLNPVTEDYQCHFYNIDTLEDGFFDTPLIRPWDQFLTPSEGSIFYVTQNNITRVDFQE